MAREENEKAHFGSMKRPGSAESTGISCPAITCICILHTSTNLFIWSYQHIWSLRRHAWFYESDPKTRCPMKGLTEMSRVESNDCISSDAHPGGDLSAKIRLASTKGKKNASSRSDR